MSAAAAAEKATPHMTAMHPVVAVCLSVDGPASVMTPENECLHFGVRFRAGAFLGDVLRASARLGRGANPEWWVVARCAGGAPTRLERKCAERVAEVAELLGMRVRVVMVGDAVEVVLIGSGR